MQSARFGVIAANVDTEPRLLSSRTGRAHEPNSAQARWQLLHQLEALLDKPLTALAFVWLGLLILDFTTGLNRGLEAASYAIWTLFLLHFLMGVLIAPRKTHYLRHNWLTIIALILPAF